jgi:hypothetical protein
MHGVPGGGTGWDRSRSAVTLVPLVPPIGTTLMSLEPFKYYLYRPYHPD